MSKDIASLDIDLADWQEVLAILEARMPEQEVWAFGSRVTGRAKRNSDLDLAFRGEHPITLDERAQLMEDFENSGLPFRVDVVDLLKVEPAFGAQVRETGIVIQKAPLSRAQ